MEHLRGLSHAGVAELVDARDLKSCVPKERAGSTPVSGTILLWEHEVHIAG